AARPRTGRSDRSSRKAGSFPKKIASRTHHGPHQPSRRNASYGLNCLIGWPGRRHGMGTGDDRNGTPRPEELLGR
ncbi:hypothetical protein ACFL5Q_03115, partial [Planctomycetota bacterium]